MYYKYSNLIVNEHNEHDAIPVSQEKKIDRFSL